MRALQRAGSGHGERLLPLAAGFPVFEHLVRADHAVIIKVELYPLGFSPDHEGCVTGASPGNGDRTVGHLVLHVTMLCQIGSGISLGHAVAGDSYHQVGVRKERCRRRTHELRMVNGCVWQHSRPFFLRDWGTRESDADCERADDPNP